MLYDGYSILSKTHRTGCMRYIYLLQQSYRGDRSSRIQKIRISLVLRFPNQAGHRSETNKYTSPIHYTALRYTT